MGLCCIAINETFYVQQWTATAAEQRPDTATAALRSCSSVKFPNVYLLLIVRGTLPVTTCESERVFSKLQRTLTSIRSTMTEDRLEALLLLQCHRQHCPTPNDVLSAFATTQLRSVAEIAEVVVWIDISAAFCPLSCIHMHIFCFTLHSRTLK